MQRLNERLKRLGVFDFPCGFIPSVVSSSPPYRMVEEYGRGRGIGISFFYAIFAAI